MRYIYIDEAGTSAREPVSVVAGVIIHADEHYAAAEDRLREVLKSVPAHYAAGFHFHATTLWGSKRYRDGWEMGERVALLKAVMAIPRDLGLPISIGMIRRSAEETLSRPSEISHSDFQHMMTFQMCIERADLYLQKYYRPEEVATVICEDHPTMKRNLKTSFQIAKLNIPLYQFPKDRMVIRTLYEIDSGISVQSFGNGIKKIRDIPFFAEKEDSPLLQIADACAFGFRRYFSGQKSGDEFARAILGYDLVEEDWAGPFSGCTFYFHPPHREDVSAQPMTRF